MKHKSLRQFLIPGALLLSLLTACGGGGGGGAAPLANGTFTRTVEAGTTGAWGAPFIDSASSTQHLYTASQVGGAGKITAIKFVANSALTQTTCSSVVVKAGHSSLTALTTTFASNINRSSAQTVYDGPVTIPAHAASDVFTLTFSTPFDYNGADNLVLNFDLSAACNQQYTMFANDAATSAALYASPSGATGTLYDFRPVTTFVFAGGEDKLSFGTSTNFWPFADTAVAGNEKPRAQHLYLASEINGSGPITGIAVQANTATVAGTYTYSLKLGHTSLTSLTTNFANNITGSTVTAANNATFTVPAGVPIGGWIWIPIPDRVFTYNGTDNLVVEIAVASGTSKLNVSTGAIAGRRLSVNDVTGTETTGAVDPIAANIALRFRGGEIIVLPSGWDASDNYPFGVGSGLSSKRQYLYVGAELGTGGKITSVACRLDNATVGSTAATSYTNLQVVMGHTSASTLGTTFANNMTGATTVFSGTYDLPAGLKAGDWIDIPLTTTFTYDPTKNLVVEMSGDGAGTGYSCDATFNDTLYASRHAFVFSRTATTGSVNSYLQSLKLKFGN